MNNEAKLFGFSLSVSLPSAAPLCQWSPLVKSYPNTHVLPKQYFLKAHVSFQSERYLVRFAPRSRWFWSVIGHNLRNQSHGSKLKKTRATRSSWPSSGSGIVGVVITAATESSPSQYGLCSTPLQANLCRVWTASHAPTEGRSPKARKRKPAMLMTACRSQALRWLTTQTHTPAHTLTCRHDAPPRLLDEMMRDSVCIIYWNHRGQGKSQWVNQRAVWQERVRWECGSTATWATDTNSKGIFQPALYLTGWVPHNIL